MGSFSAQTVTRWLAPAQRGTLAGTMVHRIGWLAILVTLLATLGLGAPRWAVGKGHVESCSTPERVPRLDSYIGIAPQSEFYVDVKWEKPGGFVPTTPIKMPLHHSSRLEWTNLEQWPVLRQRHEQVLRIHFKYLGAKIEKIPDRNRWSATYSAEIEGICLAPGAKRSRRP
jgi:hypothetical protein